jgi:hypothetical protein
MNLSTESSMAPPSTCRHDGGDPGADKWCRWKGDPYCVVANAKAYRPTLTQVRDVEESVSEWEGAQR